MGIDFTSGSSTEKRRGAAWRGRRPSDEEEADLDGEKADPSGRTPIAPTEHEQKEEDDRLPESQQGRRCGAASVYIPSRGTKRKPAGKERHLTEHDTSTPLLVSHKIGWRTKGQEGRDHSAGRLLIKVANFT